MSEAHRRVRVLIETQERCFRGFMYIPRNDEHLRLSDHLNGYGKAFICLSDAEIADRGQHWRVGEKQPFVAVAVSAITFISPLEDDRQASSGNPPA